MKLIKKTHGTPTNGVAVGTPGEAIGRRTFLRRSGLTLGGSAVAAMCPTLRTPRPIVKRRKFPSRRDQSASGFAMGVPALATRCRQGTC